MPIDLSSIVTTVFKVQKHIVQRQVTLTQTIPYADYTTTTVVTLDPGNTSPAGAPPPPTTRSPPPDPDGLGNQQVGIIVGTCLGAFFVVLVAICICYACNRSREDDSDPENTTLYIYTHRHPDPESSVQDPGRCYYPQFPHSLPPPVEPCYTAVPRRPEWCAYETTRERDAGA
ncbi:hypothetical protein F4779DRAFT_577735 [Xylariaceae sp. FL0662B]|nr:hypothetical protein F4779DRAFT_577735 [Xylariaceae sp. FL0662B]